VSEFVFGTHNAPFVQAMYEDYLRDPASVGPEWRELFDNGRLAELPIIPSERAPSAVSRTPETTATPSVPAGAQPITGPAARLVANMTESLTVPTATSFRDIQAGILDTRRKALNAQLAASGKKVSFTHLIGYGIVQAAKHFPAMTHHFQEIDGKPHRVDPGGIGLGLAVDVEKKDGSRALVVPVIKHAETMDFAAFHAAYEAVVEKARTNRLMPDDFAGGTIQLTNPGTLGTVASVPRLMKGQGSIIATGTIREIAGAKIITITSTYDHRIIQGAESGMFLRALDAMLQGEDGFYERVSESMRAPSAVSRAPEQPAGVQRTAHGARCPEHGPRPERDAEFCSECGRRLGTAQGYCARCGSALEDDARYCNRCGARVAA
jgi:pyruvate/2-oxoglutarate dehydrogenase complex dihydrolipoamide acyltransferase (E2) component